jgi:beta-glucosidase
LLPAAALAASFAGQAFAAETTQMTPEELAAGTVAKLTVDEKIAQLVNVAPAIPRLGIPAYNWWTESLHGAFGPVPTTNFPEPIGLAATFNPPLLHDVAGVIGTEVRAMHTLGARRAIWARSAPGSILGRPTSTSSAIRAGAGGRKPMARILSSPPIWAWLSSPACRA